MTVNEWAKDFKSFVNELQMPRDDYKGIMEYIDDALALLKEQEWQMKRLTPTEPKVSTNAYGVKFYYCPHCQRPIIKTGIIARPRHCEDCGQAINWECE